MTNAIRQDRQRRAAQKLQGLIETDSQIASLVPLPFVREALRSSDGDLAAIMDQVFDAYADRPALGSREYDLIKTADGRVVRQYQPSFGTITYGQLRDHVHAVADAWKHHPVHSVGPDEHVCIFGFIGVQYTILDFATAYAHAVTVPLQMGAIHMNFDEIIESIRPVTVAVSAGDLLTVTNLVANKDFVQSLVVFDYDERVDDERADYVRAAAILDAAASNVSLISLAELQALSTASNWSPLDAHRKGSARVASIVHSSGSTGKPKAAMVPEGALRLFWTSIPEHAPPVITLCLAPFSHLLGKGSMISALRQGGTAYFTLAPDMSTVFDDIRIARPTLLGLFPRIVELVYQNYQNEVGQELRRTGDGEEVVCDRVGKRMAAGYLGNRLCFVLSGGSRIAPAAREFFENCFDVPVLDAYGNTEGGSFAIDGIVQRPPVIDYKLRDVPELGYFSSDKPFPRGELCFKSTQSILGYYNAPEATANLFDQDGYICTGDIVEELAADHIRVIDRRNDVLKLSQGEFVAVSALAEAFEAGSDLIHQVYIHGDSQRSYLLAVIVPNMAVAASLIEDIADEQALKALLQREVHRVSGQQGIRSFEVPKAFLVETEPFTGENGLLSGLRKKVRPAIARQYGARLEALYEDIERKKQEGRSSLADKNSSLSVLEKLVKLLEFDLNIYVAEPDSPATFYELGGDSLGAVLFSLSIEEIFGVELPADRLLSPTGTLKSWAEHIERTTSGTGQRPTAASIHGKGSTSISRENLALGNFIAVDLLEAARSLPGPSVGAKRILLTGANGFLGRFLCLDSLDRAAQTGGKLVCIVRASSDAQARERLDSVFAGSDPEMEARYRALAADHLEVLAGDVGDPQLGLNDQDYRRLSLDVDRVIHAAALVNHRLCYADLFGPNVLGTAEIIRFTMTGRRKAIDFVSTIAVLPLLDTSQPDGEDTPLLDRIDLVDDYAAGYGASKWASEQLLAQARTNYGVQVNIFRGDMMLPHQAYRGQINTADMFSRLLYSVIRTGIAPYSFHPLAENGIRAKAHYDGLPVDVVASTIVSAKIPDDIGRVYNMANYHYDDGCSLDSFIDWIEQSGFEVSRIDDYQLWVSTFKLALSRLPDDQQRYSALDIMDAFVEPLPSDDRAIACAHFKELVRTTAEGSDIPHLSREYILKCLSDLHALGLVAPIANTRLRTG